MHSPEEELVCAKEEILQALRLYHESLDECLDHLRAAHHHIEEAAAGVEEQIIYE